LNRESVNLRFFKAAAYNGYFGGHKLLTGQQPIPINEKIEPWNPLLPFLMEPLRL
jgi:hypothetical protein